MKVLAIGDPHFMVSNLDSVKIYINKMVKLAKDQDPDFIVVLGDLLHTHEKIHSTVLRYATRFLRELSEISPVYLIIGNHDMCFGIDTPVLMWDGSKKMSQDIKIGDILIGDDGNQRKVSNTTSGESELYKIKQLNGDDYIVNKNHILTLKCGFHKSKFWNKTKRAWTVKWIDKKTMSLKSKFFSINYRDSELDYLDRQSRTIEDSEKLANEFLETIEDIDTLEISVEDYLKVPINVKDRLYGYKLETSVKWNSEQLFDPYILGMWLGDGDKDGSGFSGADPKIIMEWVKWGFKNGAEIVHTGPYNYNIRNKFRKTNRKSIINSSGTECDACLRHITKYNKAPSLSCASVEELNKILEKDSKTINYYFKNSSKEQQYALKDDVLIKEIIYLKTSQYSFQKVENLKNPLQQILKKYNLYKNKHIPNIYLTSNEDTRLKLLAGFVDTDGHTQDKRTILINQGGDNIHMIDQLAYLTRSLGFSTYISPIIHVTTKNGVEKIYKKITVSGNIEKIPILINRKKGISIINNGIDSRGRKCADKSRTKISVESIGIGKYYGWTLNENNRFLLGDFTVAHNCNNQAFLDNNHAFTSFKNWENLTVCDRVREYIIEDKKFVFCPYVPPGRFKEALDTLPNWETATAIFAHQEFLGCRFNPVAVSEIGDPWDSNLPLVVSGHIHDSQWVNDNVFYPGSSIQHAFGESADKTVVMITFKDKPKFKKYNLGMRKKKIIYLELENIDSFKPDNSENEIKLVLKGTSEEFKTFRKSKKYHELTKNIKVSFIPRESTIDITNTNNIITRKKSVVEILKDLINDEPENVKKALDSILK